jgi:hypothetical protein
MEINNNNKNNDNNTILTHKTVTTYLFSKNTPKSHNNIVNFHVYISTWRWSYDRTM